MVPPAARLILVAGVSVLLIVVALGVAANQRDADRERDRIAAERAGYDRALGRAAAQPARFEVAYVQVPLSDFQRLTGEGRPDRYHTVRTLVAQRIQTGNPSRDPRFGDLPHSSRLEALAVAFREGRLSEAEVSVVALLVRAAAARGSADLRLRVERTDPNGFVSIVDPQDLVQGTPRRNVEDVRWSMAGRGAPALVPLALVHEFVIPDTAANAEVLAAYDGVRVWRLVTDTVLAPGQLFVRPQSGAREVEVRIWDALSDPYILRVSG